MEEKQFATLTSEEFIGDYNKKCAAVEKAEGAADRKRNKLDKQCKENIENIKNALEADKMIIQGKLAKIDAEIKERLKKAEEKCAAGLRDCESRVSTAQRAFAKAEKDCENSKAKTDQESRKSTAEIEQKYKNNVAAEERRYKEVVKQREADIKKEADEFDARKAELKASYEAGVAEIKAKITDLHKYYKAQKESDTNEFNQTKDSCTAKITEKQKEFDALQAEYSEKMNNCEKQKMRLLKNELNMHKNSCDSAVAMLRSEIATAEKVYEVKCNDTFAQLVKELTWQQYQLRSLKANYDCDNAEVGYEQRIADVRNQNRMLAEEREHEEKLGEFELDKQDELNKKNSYRFCGDFDIEIAHKSAIMDFDVAMEEEEKNMRLVKLVLDADAKVIDSDRLIAEAECKTEIADCESKAERDIKAENEKCRHNKQIEWLDMFSLAVKTANKSEKLLNQLKAERMTNSINAQIEKVKDRLASDLAFIATLRDYQAAEYDAVKIALETFYEKQKQPLMALAQEAEQEGRENEKDIFSGLVIAVESNKDAAAESLKEQAKRIDEMIDAEENRIKEQAEKELDALSLFIKESEDLMTKHSDISDELATAASERHKNAVVDLLGISEGWIAEFDGELVGKKDEHKNECTAFSKATVVEKEVFLQSIDDKKDQEEKACKVRQSEINDKYAQFYNEANKNKAISKGVIEEQLNKTLDARQDKKAENVQLLARKANELKSFENACNRTVAAARKEADRKIDEYEKLRAREEKWLLKNGKVDYRKEWWVVDFE